MKKSSVIFFLLSFLLPDAFSQNVGIGISNPLFRLDVSTSNTAAARFSGAAGMFISLQEDAVNRGYLGSFAGNAEDVDFGTSSGNATGKLHLTTQTTTRLSILPNGNVGIGTTSPTALLHLNGGMKINGTNSLEFGAGIAGKELNAGEITYGYYSPHVLEIVGGGTLPSNRVIRFFNEGMAWFDGPIYLSQGNVTRAASGSAGLLPAAFGEVTSAGTISTGASTGNFSILKTGTGVYEVNITGVSGFSGLPVLVTPKAAAIPRLATYTSGPGVGKIIIYIYNISGTPIDGSFGFVVYNKAG